MEWSEQHDLALCQEVLVMDPFQFPYRSKERGDVWNQIATNLNASDHPKFKVNKRSVRDRLTLLQTKYKAKIRQEERASGIDCDETDLDRALEEIINKEKVATDTRSSVEKKKGEKAAAEEQRQRAVERLGETKRRNGEGTGGDDQAKPKKTRRSSSDAVQFLREKAERENELRKEEFELRRKELSAKEDLMKAFMQQQQQQTQVMLALLAQRKEENKS